MFVLCCEDVISLEDKGSCGNPEKKKNSKNKQIKNLLVCLASWTIYVDVTFCKLIALSNRRKERISRSALLVVI